MKKNYLCLSTLLVTIFICVLSAFAQPITKGANLPDQQRCSEYAHMKFTRDQMEGEKQSEDIGIKSKPGEITTTLEGSHFSSNLSRCFMKTNTLTIITTTDRIITTKVIYDAYEDTPLAEYIWQTEKDKKYWEVAPKVCRVKLPTGEEKQCHSEQEFNQLADPYITAGLTP